MRMMFVDTPLLLITQMRAKNTIARHINSSVIGFNTISKTHGLERRWINLFSECISQK